ncbi:adenylate cyclase type 10-like [Glandiceps talaboti]
MSTPQFTITTDSGATLKVSSIHREGSHFSIVHKTGEIPNQLATHVPDIVVRCNLDKELPSVKNLDSVLMFADISGFTALCEKFAMSTKGGCGTDRLSKALNDYLGAIVENILSSGGDVLNFAGDALLALWEVDNSDFFEDTVLRAVECGLNIQKKCDNWDTDVGVKLRVKIGLADGPLHVTYFGNHEDSRLFVATGQAVDEVNKAEGFAISGSVTLSPTAWGHIVEQEEFTYEYLSDGKHVRIWATSSRPETPNGKRGDLRRNVVDSKLDKSPSLSKVNKLGLQSFVRKLSTAVPGQQVDIGALVSTQSPIAEESEDNGSGNEEMLTKRVEVFTTPTSDEEKRLRLYVMKTVLQKIDDDLPLEYLSEMRQVTIIFINMTLAEVSKREEADVLQASFGIIHNGVKRFHGNLNKIFMFDKGCTFLAIFGLPGDKHEDDCLHALQCSYKLFDKLKSTQSILQVSIGVTTGKTFCGVVGHKYRHEYTVIGSKVNMAARLMMHYPGRLSCDPETYHHSKLPRYLFLELPHREMKGVKNPGVIHEYVEISKKSMPDLTVSESEYPLLGRDKELKKYMDELHLIVEHMEKGEHRRVIVYEGDPGIGKSRMLEACIAEALREGIRVVSCSLTLNDSGAPYHTVITLLELLLEMENCANHVEREHAVLDHIKEEGLHEDLCILNDLLNVKFPTSGKVSQMSCADRSEALHRLLVAIVHQFTLDKCVIFTVDDAHFIDRESWEFITDLSKDSSAVCLLSMRPFPPNRTSCPAAARVLFCPNTLHIKLEGLNPDVLASLACQMLDVISIPGELLKILKERSHGVASWCEQLIRDMYYANKIQVVSEEEAGKRKDEGNDVSVTADSGALQRTSRRSSVSSRGSSVTHSRKGSANIDEQMPPVSVASRDILETVETSSVIEEEGGSPDGEMSDNNVCIVAPGVRLQDIPVPDSMKGMLLAKIDRMKAGDQMVVKCAAVLGLTCTRSLLEAIVPNASSRKIRLSVHSLMNSRIFECAAKPTDPHSINMGSGLHHGSVSHHGHQRLSTRVECHCPRTTDTSLEARTNISNCKLLRFKTSMMQEVAYTLFLSDQRRKLHEQAALFLESQAHKCKHCGGGEFVPHYQSVSHTLPTGQEHGKGSADAGAGGPSRGMRRSTAMGGRKADRSFRKERRSSTISDIGEVAEEPRRRSTFIEGVKGLFSKRTSQVEDEELAALQAKTQRRRRDSLMSNMSGKLREEVNADVLDEEITYFDIDLRDCECPQVLASVYPQLVRHWRAANNTDRTVHFLTEAGGAAVATHNTMAGLSYLLEAHTMLKDLDSGRKPLLEDPCDHIDIEDEDRARVESLIGQALLHMGRSEEALPHLYDALKCLGDKQPSTKIGSYYRYMTENFTQYLHLKYPHKYVGHASSLKCNLFVEQTRCLCHVWHAYHEKHEDFKALLAALQQVNRAEKADDDFRDLMLAYMTMIESCQTHSWHGKVELYEEMALSRCLDASGFNADDLITVGQLHCVAMAVRLADGRIQKAIDSGFQGLKVSEKLHDNNLKLHILPPLAQALIMGNRSVPVVEVLELLGYISEEEEEPEGRGWYFCCCLDLLLELGFALETHDKCVEFVTKAAVDPCHILNPIPRYYMNGSLALWHSRKNHWDEAEKWFISAKDITPDTFETYMAANAYTKIVQAQLLALCHAINVGVDVRKMKSQASQALRYLQFLCKKFPSLKPRYHHMHAYFYILSEDLKSCRKSLTKSIGCSEEMDNVLEHQWADHSQIVWFDPNHSVIQDELWQLSTEDDLDWHIATAIDGEINKYSLPIPRNRPRII